MKRKILGGLLLLLPFIGLFAFAAYHLGWQGPALTSVAAIGGAALFMKGLDLFLEKKEPPK